MTDKQKEAIEIFEELKRNKEIVKNIDKDFFFEFGETALNLIQTQKAEIEKKDKIIDLMIKVMIDSSICDYFIKQNCKHYAGENKKLCDVCIKEYFERKVENETSI